MQRPPRCSAHERPRHPAPGSPAGDRHAHRHPPRYALAALSVLIAVLASHGALIELTPRAQRQVRDLSAAYVRLERPDPLRNLVAAAAEAARMIERSPAAGLPSPRPHPALPEQAWVKVGPYWVLPGPARASYSCNPVRHGSLLPGAPQ